MTLAEQLFVHKCFDIASAFYTECKRQKPSALKKQNGDKMRTRTCSKRQRDREYLREWRKNNKSKCREGKVSI